MLRRALSAMVAAAAVTGLAGCNVLQNLATGSAAAADYTGNYAFAQVPSSAGQTTGPVIGLIGGVANSGSAFTATFRLLTTGACVSPTADLRFTGTRASSGQITLISDTLVDNPISIVWDDAPTQSSNGVGTYTISGKGPCAMGATQFVSDAFSPVTGTYVGSFTTGNGVQGAVTAQMFQGAANADGQFPETGMLVLSTPTCTNNFTVSGIVTGPTMAVEFNPMGGSSLGGFVAVLPDHVLTLSIPAGITVRGACNPGTFSGTLAKQ
jgi:hypothetical protein